MLWKSFTVNEGCLLEAGPADTLRFHQARFFTLVFLRDVHATLACQDQPEEPVFPLDI